MVDLLLIGDSITAGQGGEPAGFRDDLRTLLNGDASNTYDFVGSSGSPPLEGHFLGGQQIDAFYPPGAGAGWGTGTFDVTSDMGPPVPDMVAIHLGTNDVNSAPAPYAPYSLDHGQTLIHSQSGELADFVRYLNRWYSGPTSTALDYIVLSTIIPMNNREADVRDFNREVVAMSEDLSEGIATGTPVKVTIADHNRRFLTNPNLFTFGAGDWMVDNLHPNNAGYAQMADVYNQAIRNAVNDIVAPEPVINLTVIAVEVDRVRFAFTAPGDDAANGRAYRYDLRYSTGTITSGNFALATQAVDELEPPIAGQLDTLEVTGLFPGTTYDFALKVVDDSGNRSAMSNVRSATTIGGGTQTIVLRQGLNGYNGSEDNSALDVRPFDNNGGGTDFQVGRRGSTNPDIARSLIRFDVSQIPPGATISSAKLKLYSYQLDAATPANVAAYRVTKEWVEGTKTGFEQQSGSSCWNAARLSNLNWSGPGVSAASNSAQNDDPNFDRYSTPEATTSVSAIPAWYEWDVRNAVEKWRDGVWNNDGLVLIAQSESVRNRRWFRSSEATVDQTQRPTLEVTYVSSPINSPPIANAGGPYTGSAGSPVAFNGSGSFDPEGQPLTYLWSFGDGSTGVGPTPTHTYASGGNFAVSLTVNDGQATSDPDLTSAQISGATTYTITATAGPNGSIAPSGAVTVASGANQAFTITPNTGYHVANVLVDNVSVGAVTSYTFNNVTANHTIAASFAINTYTITASAGANGAIAPSGAVSVNHGANQAFTITPNANYHVADVLVDGVSAGAVTSYTFNNVTANHTIAASFAINTYTITASAGSNGAIAPSGAVSVNHGANQAFTITPNTGYHVANVLVDNVSVGAVTSYTFNNVTANHTIAASFAINTYTITASAGANGAIAPSGAVSVNHGANQAFTITPNANYHVADVLVDGVSAGAVTSYTFNNVTANHTIAASFAINTYTITASAGANGAIAPSGAVSVNHGANQAFTITPNTGFHVADVLVDGVSAGAVTSYTFNNVTANHTIAASFAINTYTITASAGSNGAIAPSGAVSVNHGANQAFTITPNTGYHVADVLVDGVSAGGVTSYTFNNVTANHTIAASFAINTYAITASAGAGGAIAPSGAVSVNHGANQAFTITPNTGFHVADVLVDGVSAGAVTSYTFNNVTANHTIAASFAINTYTITASAGSGGAIAPSGAVSVNHGANQAFTITPNTGFHVADVLVDGVSAGAVTSYTFNNVTANHTIAASFAINTYTITASAGAGGAIAPSGAVTVNHGANQAFTITPNTGFHVADVLVDGVSAGAVTSYTFNNVTANHTIAASFAINTYTIAASAGDGGSITPEGTIQVAHGDSLAFAITPDIGFQIADVMVDKVSVGVVDHYTFIDVTANHTIIASFEPDITHTGGSTAPILRTVLLRSAPNPFGYSTTIRFEIAGPTSAELAIYSVDGRRVRLLGNQQWETGHYELAWNGKDDDGGTVAAGTYFVRMKTPAGIKVQKITYTR